MIPPERMSAMSMNDFDSFSYPDTSFRQPAPGGRETHGWHWALTLLSLVLVSGLSFLMAVLTKDVQDRSVWLMGLIFMVPAGAMFLAAMIMEFSLGAMTPSTSRRAQTIIATAATLATFLVACLCDAIYLYGGFIGESSDNVIFLVYERNAVGNTKTDQAIMGVVDEIMQKSGSRVQVGLFIFDTADMSDSRNNGVIDFAPLTKELRSEIYDALILGKKKQSISYGHEQAYHWVENSGTTRPTRMIFVCDFGITYGNGHYTQTEWDRDLIQLANDRISLYFMSPATPEKGMKYMAEHSGGQVLTNYSADDILTNLRAFVRSDGDMLRADTHSATVLTGVMLILEGLVIGLGMMLLLSVRGQMRFQVILSPLLAVLAFLLLKVLPIKDSMPQWVLEAVAFSLLGIVIMRRNYAPGAGISGSAAPPAPDPFGAPQPSSDPFGF